MIWLCKKCGNEHNGLYGSYCEDCYTANLPPSDSSRLHATVPDAVMFPDSRDHRNLGDKDEQRRRTLPTKP